MVRESATVLQQWLKNNADETLRHDYNELASLSLLFLGNTVYKDFYASDISVKAPGAIHNARWIAKALYTLKIALYWNQLQEVYSLEKLQEITSLATFLAIFYTESWLTCTESKDAPSNDLKLVKKNIYHRRSHQKEFCC